MTPPGQRVRIYPSDRAARHRTITRDVTVVCCLAIFAWLAINVHDQVAGLEQLGIGVAEGGRSVQHGFNAVAGSVAGVPIVGGDLSRGLRSAGASTGGAAVNAGLQGESEIARVATLIGWLTFLLPTVLLMQRYIPNRVRQIRQMTAAAQVLYPSADDDHQRVIAQRAAFSLPYQQLLRHTRDPLEDLRKGHYEPLIAAILEDVGIQAPRRAPRPPRKLRSPDS